MECKNPGLSYNQFGKVGANSLTPEWWSKIRPGELMYDPVVVLANVKNKDKYVQEAPYHEAYCQFEQHLKDSAQWLIVGYSFRDIAVNQMLRRAIDYRKFNAFVRLEILVSDVNSSVNKELLSQALEMSFSELENKVTFHHEGACNLLRSPEYLKFMCPFLTV